MSPATTPPPMNGRALVPEGAKAWLAVSIRLAFGAFVVLTSLYCILAYVPFTYYQFLQFDHIASLTLFVKVHHLLFALLVSGLAFSLQEDRRAPRTGLLAVGFLVFHAGVALYLLVRPLLPNLANDGTSLAWSLGWLGSLVWLQIIDVAGHSGSREFSRRSTTDDGHIFATAFLTALFLSALNVAITVLRFGMEGLGVDGAGLLVVASWAVAGNLVLFMALAVILSLLRAAAGTLPKPPAVEYVLFNGLLILVAAALVRNVIFAGIAFDGPMSNVLALSLAIASIGYVAGLRLRTPGSRGQRIDSGLEWAVSPLSAGRISSAAGRGGTVFVLAMLAYVLATRTAAFDWNFLVQKLAVALVAGLSFACVYAMVPRSPETRDRTVAMLLVAVASLGFYKGLQYLESRPAGDAEVSTSVGARRDLTGTLNGYAAYDVAFTLVRDTLSRAVPADKSLYSFLQANTNIPRAMKLEPVDVRLVENLTPGKVDPPHIFVFVIDSLRQDYVSPYNGDVRFTPEIESFARDSVVFRNAFTRYGATGLSQPSIWVGGMILHQQYTTPFSPMNALNKLLVAENYQRFLSMDTILNVIVPDDPDIVKLNEDLPGGSDDFCRSLEDLQAKLDARSTESQPVFAYIQPQDIHISVINREGNMPVDDEDYSGFYAPYASRIRRMDGCFGAFIGFLEDRGLYDESVIVLTSDHGDSLGEEGRWGHAYTIVPEVVRIPLLVHLPGRLANDHAWDEEALAFSADLTPSLYYLLGHKPILERDNFGRPLFTETLEEQTAYAKTSHLIASSYGAVYGLLLDRGNTLYIVNGVNYTDYVYDLRSGFAGTRGQVTASQKREYQRLIRQHIENIGSFYGYRSSGSERTR